MRKAMLHFEPSSLVDSPHTGRANRMVSMVLTLVVAQVKKMRGSYPHVSKAGRAVSLTSLPLAWI